MVKCYVKQQIHYYIIHMYLIIKFWKYFGKMEGKTGKTLVFRGAFLYNGRIQRNVVLFANCGAWVLRFRTSGDVLDTFNWFL